MDIPGHLLYTTDHEWVLCPDDASETATMVKVGLTAYAVDALGDVVFVDLPAVGATVQANESLGEVESTKSVSDVYAPLSGSVKAVNEELTLNPGLINADPYGQGWLVELEISGMEFLDSLLDAAAYKDLTGEVL